MKNRWLTGVLLGLCLPMAAGAATMPSPVPIAFSNEAHPGSAGAGRYLAHAKAMHAADIRIVGLLNAKAYRQAAPRLERTAKQYDDAWAGFALGNLYAAGLGVAKSQTRAFHWYLWSAKAGDRSAQRQVANAYLNGDGVTRNPAQAAYWFRMGMAVPQLVNSNYWLAKTYDKGRGVPKNAAKYQYYLQHSQRILRSLNTEPNGAATYDMGLSYAYGHGAPRDRAKALQWLNRALKLHYAPAAVAIHRLESARRKRG
ncbi:hypothetical protein A4U49_07935 [Acidithiobacillus ferrivorans]|uniref:tetratricopeptide repeat protein n=1 Tax=Acidithiobacillus ferrivorans TaxID=160808 RepID=UPI000893A356|nr:tetratricopeptide repeat protein [Acidithiobacillus ferrivorans]OFA16350.1 hypothetical protein A4U49_07935 [Acidithiobacillus ferrivorans]